MNVSKSASFFSVVAAIFIVSYFVEQDRDQTRQADARRFDQTREDDQTRATALHTCVDQVNSDDWQRNLFIASFKGDCTLELDKSRCVPMSAAELSAWRKQASDEEFANKKLATDVCIAASRK